MESLRSVYRSEGVVRKVNSIIGRTTLNSVSRSNARLFRVYTSSPALEASITKLQIACDGRTRHASRDEHGR